MFTGRISSPTIRPVKLPACLLSVCRFSEALSAKRALQNVGPKKNRRVCCVVDKYASRPVAMSCFCAISLTDDTPSVFGNTSRLPQVLRLRG